ncbi:hypothetical protein [Agaribacterium haliotis]|uniref:hypothetical protein n=1 Tax=Agaribacterium haliotis TaxID=2013869 RepID=UPI001178524F|nr:hypothetical protein [Agaribacterium haliotis]
MQLIQRRELIQLRPKALCLFVLTALTMLGGCQLQPQKQPKSAGAYAESAAKHYQRWLGQSGSIDELKLAVKEFEYATSAQPHNARYRLEYYQALLDLALNDSSISEAALLEQYRRLHPAARAEVASPAYVSYRRAQRNQQNLDTQLEHALRATEQNPANSQNWLFSAELFKRQELYNNALHSIDIAIDLNPKVTQYTYEKGRIYIGQAFAKRCSGAEKQLLQQAANHFSLAAREQPQNSRYSLAASQSYIALGMPALALMEAQRSYKLKPDNNNVRALYSALFFSSQFDEAFLLIDQYPKSAIDTPANRSLKLWYELRGQKDLSQERAEQFLDNFLVADLQSRGSVFNLSAFYLLALSERDYREIFQYSQQQLSTTERQRFSELSELYRTPTAELKSISGEACSKNELSYYQALQLANNGDIEAAKAKMRKLSKEKINHLSMRRWWAQLLSEAPSSGAQNSIQRYEG